MFLQRSIRVRSSLFNIPLTEALKVNRGAIYLVASRGMASSEMGSGAGKGGGSGGRLVEPKKIMTSFKSLSQSIKSALKLKLSSNDIKQPPNSSNSSSQSSVREAGGSIGKKGAAQEEMYFSKQNKEMKDKLKDHLKEEIRKHEEAIKAGKELMKEIEKEK